MDKENATVDLANFANVVPLFGKSIERKTRSKSLGPGEVKTALTEDAGNRRKSVAVPAPKSILKSSIPLSPLKEIPSRRSPISKNNESPARTPTRSPRTTTESSQENEIKATRNSSGKSPTAGGAKSPIQPTPSPRAHDRSHEESARRQKERVERRRTMASRRVSFAPEATLHTWDVVEYIQDSTTSSASTNSTRRASAFAGSPHPTRKTTSLSPNSATSAAAKLDGDEVVPESPAQQRDLHQKRRRRRSSTVPPMNFNKPDDLLSSSPSSEGSATKNNIGTSPDSAIESSSDTEDDDETHEAEEDDVDENTVTSIASNASGSSESARLDAALRQAVVQAQTKNVDFDEDGEMSMEMAGDDVTAAFKPWSKRNATVSRQSLANLPAQDQENVDPFSQRQRPGAISRSSTNQTQNVQKNEDISMDMTRAVGGILQPMPNSSLSSRKSVGRRQSVRVRRRSSGESSVLEDGTMDLTTSIGGIQSSVTPNENNTSLDLNEELSMEFTSVFGGIKRNGNGSFDTGSRTKATDIELASTQLQQEQRHASFGADNDGEMEMTTAVGGIVQDESRDSDQTAQMEMTTAVGRILPASQGRTADRTQNRRSLSAQSPLRSTVASRARAAVSTTDTGSPELTNRQVGSGKTPECTPVSTPSKKPSTPSGQITPKPTRPRTPEKATPSKNVVLRSASPKRLFQEEIKAAKSPLTAPSPFRRGNPGVILAPPTSGGKQDSIKMSKAENTGSPRAAALLDRRASIGDTASSFKPQIGSLGVRFGDPQAIEAELMRERKADERRESAQFILKQEADVLADDVTTNLKDLIGSMTPKKSMLNGRKSLATGGGKALLGKRPRELDYPEEDESPKRLRHQESPVKKIRLPAPPTKSETIGKDRLFTPTISSPVKHGYITTPKSQGRFKNAEALPSAQKPLPTMGQESQQGLHVEDVDEPIHLQDFLNMTNIRFMELNTTKRRHTNAPAAALAAAMDPQGPGGILEAAIVAGSCTVPMLGLYQHSCRELKQYISAGRDIVREIEDYTFEENPPVFRDYLSASTATRASMENQFKNIKSHARLLSKEMWYEWRMKLLEGINEDLMNVAGSLRDDDAALQRQEALLNVVIPAIVEEHQLVGVERETLQQKADELAECDQDELKEARRQLAEINAAIEERKGLLQIHQQNLREKEGAIEDVNEAKAECIDAIREAKRLREECRGWSIAEVDSLKAQVEDLAESTGWRVVSASSTTLTMVYRDDIELYFDPATWASGTNSDAHETPIGLSYAADSASTESQTKKSTKCRPLTTEKRFFLQFMQAHLHSLSRDVEVVELLQYVSTSWDMALDVATEIRLLDRENLTTASIVSDERLLIKSTLLIPSVETKVLLGFSVKLRMEQNELLVDVSPWAEAVYGEKYKEDRIRDFLHSKIGSGVGRPQGLWADAVRDLKGRLIVRGRKP